MAERVECLQTKIGSCNGCPVQEMAVEKIKHNGESPQAIVERISTQLCPESTTIQMPRQIKQSIW